MSKLLWVWTAALVPTFGRCAGDRLTDLPLGSETVAVSDIVGGLRVTWWPEGDDRAVDAAVFRAPEGARLPFTAEADGDLFDAELDLRRGRDGAAVVVALKANRDEPREHHVCFAAPFGPDEWTRQFYPMLPYRVLAPEESAVIRFLASAGDATPLSDSPHVVYYPFGVLENDAEFLLWGSLDVGQYSVLTPNADPGCVPCVSLRPRRIQAGQTFRFELTLKRFPKPDCQYRDVLRWYLSHLESSDPLTKALVKYHPQAPAPHTRAGNLFGGTGGLLDATFRGASSGLWRYARLGKLWFQGWGDWQETYPTEGVWWNELGRKISAAAVAAEIGRLKSDGVLPLLYCRQFLVEEGVYEDRPPYEAWLGRDVDGAPAVWSSGGEPPPAMAEQFGLGTLSQSGADFGNPDFLDWYIARIKAAVDYYLPGGIAWDMGWATPGQWQYSRANPRTAMCHGELRAQAELWQYVRRKYPDMEIIANEAHGSLSQLFAHGVLIEGGSLAGKGELDYEAAKAIGTTVVAYEYPDQYALTCGPLDLTTYRYCAFRYRARNVRTGDGDYVVYLSEGVPGREGCLIANRDIEADGAWHTLVVECARVPTVEGLKLICLGEFATESGDAHLQVEYIRFTDQPDGSPASRRAPEGPAQFPAEIRFGHTYDWIARPQYLPGRAADSAELTAAGGVADFAVETPGKGMRWLYSLARPAVAGEYMQVLAWGACLGGGIADGLPELYEFSAEAMGLAPLVESSAIEVSAPGVAASAWTGQGKLLIAARNGRQQPAAGQVTVRLPRGERPRWRGPRSLTIQVIGPGGRPASRRRFIVRSLADAVTVPVELEPRRGLLVSSN